MKNFKSLKKGNTHDIELDILKTWQDEDILLETIKNRENEKNFVFYDGPATANGMPGLHHMLAKFLKDTFCKYQTMKGNKVLRKVGWDTHGLPVEVQVEKELGFNGKGDIEKYGIKEFNEKCREAVWKNEEAFSRFTKEMGQFIDLKNSYVTYNNDYIETEWWILKKFFDEGLFYEGVKIVPFCTRCGTGLASHEVSQGYKEISVDTVIVPFKLKNKDEYFLVWTTTPWTLLSNVALCVNPNEEYIKVKSKDYKFILAKKLANKVLGDDFTVLETFKGKDLEYVEYEQLIPELSVNKKAFFVTNDTYVTMEDGTGIVHIAPAFGQDDANVAKNYDLPYLNPVSEEGCYTEGPWKGMKVFDADLEVIKYLKENDKLFKKQKMVHNYPHCWRCKTPLLYYSKPSYYLEVTKLKDKIIEANKTVNWYPDFVGEKRFGNWLENLNDWAISRQRYFGVPFPVWYCKECGTPIFARKEDLPVNPLVDKPHCDKCSHCGGDEFVPETDVMDTWATSSVTPLINMRYGENDNYESILKPMSLRTNASEIIRTWDFYTIVKSFYHFGVKPWENVMISGFVMANKGEKISKSKGNSKHEPIDLINEYSADVVRYWAGTGRLGTDIVFSEETLLRGKKLINKIWNVSKFVQMHLEDYEDKEFNDFEYIDKWILGKFKEVENSVINYLEDYEVGLALNALEKFFWEFCDNYIEIVKHRLYRPEEFGAVPRYSGQKTVYILLYKLLQYFSIFFPFITEEIFQDIYHNNLSIHTTEIMPLEYDFDEEVKYGDKLIEIISQARGSKTNNNVSLKTVITNISLGVDEKLKEAIENSIKDFKATLFINNIDLKVINKDEFEVYNIELDLNDKEN